MARKRASDRSGSVLWLTCEECGRPLERTPGGFMVCPAGHGKLCEESKPASEPVTDLFSPSVEPVPCES